MAEVSMLMETEDDAPAADIPSADKDKDAGVEIILDLVRERVEGQREQVDGLDNKAGFVLTSATILLGTALTAQVAITQSSVSVFGHSLSRALPLVLLVLPYLAAVATAYQAYKVRPYSLAPEPDMLVMHFLDAPPGEVRENVARAMAKAFADNLAKVKEKVKWTRWALWALGIETVVLMLVLIVESLG
jgi:hypothetical protein